MASFGAIYVQIESGSEFDEIDATIRKNGYLFTLRHHDACPWVQLWVDEIENVGYHAPTVSGLLPDRRVVGIACQSVVDAIGYWDLFNGDVQRALTYGFQQERTWEKTDGTPQHWELEIFRDREGHVPNENPKIGSISPFFSSADLQKIGALLNLPGFGTPGPGETWTREVIN